MAIIVTDGSTSGVQTGINSAATGDTVVLPTGTFTWSTGVTCTKSISIIGSSYTPGGQSTIGAPTLATVINWTGSGVAFNINPPSVGGNAYFRLSGISFTGFTVAPGAGQTAGISVGNSAVTNDPYRIDNCSLNCGNNNYTLIGVNGNGPGLIDHCSFTVGAGETIHNLGLGATSTAGWQDNIVPGSNQFVYCENCQFNNINTSVIASFTQGYYGSRSCFRYNTCVFGQFDQHGNTNVGARWFEFYSNTFNVPSGQNQSNFITIRGGSGFIYNNITSGGPNLGAGTINLYSNFTNNPPSYGPGAGIITGSITASNTNSPVWIWNNGTGSSTIAMPVGSGSSNVIQGVNYVVESIATTPTDIRIYQLTSGAQTNYPYVPYTYPHPLINQTQTTFVLTGTATITGTVNPTLSGGGVTPLLVQHVATSFDAVYFTSGNVVANMAGTIFTLNFPNLTLSDNTLILSLQWQGGGTIASVQDSAGNAFAAGPTFTNSSNNNYKAQIFYLIGCVAGLTGIVVNFGTGTINAPQACFSEWCNMSSGVPTISSSSSTSLSPGALANVPTGALVYYYACDISDNTVVSSTQYNTGFIGTTITAGTGFTALSMDLAWGYLDQYQITTASGTVTPGATTSGSATWGSLALVFNGGSRGTVPGTTQMRIVNMYTAGLPGRTVGGPPVLSKLYFPSVGNSLVAVYNAGNAGLTGIIDTNANTWTALTANNHSGNISQQVYSQNANPGSALQLTLSFAAGTTGPCIKLYDIVNGSTSSLFNNSVNSSGNQTTNGNLTTSTVTGTSGGLIIEVLAVTWNTVNSAVASGMFFDAAVESIECNNVGTNGTAASPLEEDNGYGHFYPTSSSPVTFQYGFNTSASAGGGHPGAQAWSSQAVAYNSSAMPAGPFVVQSTKGSATSGSTVSATFASNTTSTNTIVAIAQGYDGATLRTVTSVAVSPGAGTFSKIIAQPGTSGYPANEAWGAANITGATTPTVTVTFSGAITGADVFIYEVSGLSQALTPDGTPAANTSSGTALTTSGITTNTPSDIIFSAFAVTANVSATGGGWVGQIGTANKGAAQYQITTGTQTGLTGTATQSAAGAYSGIIFALQSGNAPAIPGALTGSVTLSGSINPTYVTTGGFGGPTVLVVELLYS